MSAIVLSIALRRRIAAAVAATLGLGLVPQLAAAEPKHGIAMHGEPALPPDYQHLPYANPDAPKGGSIGLSGQGTFDSLNPFILKGSVPDGLWAKSAFWPARLWDSLMVRSWDEPFTLYGHVAEFVETPEDRSWVEFTINPLARFQDGEPITAEDVAFSFELLKDHGLPRDWHKKVDRVEVNPGNKVRFVFGEDWDREMPLLIGLIPVFPKHATDPEAFATSGLTPPPGSGPYKVSSVKPGSTVVLARDPDYWAKDLPQKRGFDNFDEVRIEYFRDGGTLFEAFRKGLFNVMTETNPVRWETEYDFPAAAQGQIALNEFVTGTPKGMNGFVFNQRRPVFEDVRVREAMAYFLDFEWINRNLFADAYERTGSYFQGSTLSGLGVPADDAEQALLAPFPDAVRDDVMDGTYAPPASDGSGRDRANFRKGIDLLESAGWTEQDGRMVNAETGEPFTFEFLALNKEEERLALALQRSLRLVGIDMQIRTVDSTQYWERVLNTRDFDMMRWTYGASLSPGNEQFGRWSKISADTYGRLNFAGVSEPAVDAMIAAMLSATEWEEFVAAVRSLDRVLISGFHVIPLFHSPEQWVATWDNLQLPDRSSTSGAVPASWWAAE
ncbi:extracellular solute-binding protein [Bauldia sp.]|uniref:extracellular solute-binding protein n=1 Tax=Bauldia sp. TaxID=2575872 RepID=UPI003BAD497E